MTTHEFHDDALDERSERDLLALLRVVEIFGENGSDFGIGISLELVPALLENETKFLVCRSRLISAQPAFARIETGKNKLTVGDDTVVNDSELLHRIRHVRVTVGSGGNTVSSPSNSRYE